jgi:hypothetical protein
MSKKESTTTQPTLTREQKRTRELEARVGVLEDQVLLCLRYMRFEAEKQAEKITPLIKAKGIPQA